LLAIDSMELRATSRFLLATSLVFTAAAGLRSIASTASATTDADGLCGASEVVTFPSPDGARAVHAKIVDCGATTDFALRISIGPPTEWMALMMRPTKDLTFDHASSSPRDSLDVTWTGAREVTLTVTTRDHRLGPSGALRSGDVQIRWERARPR
jgi:hypothetical protein